MERYEVKVYLSSGSILTFYCDKYEIKTSSRTGSIIGYSFKKTDRDININIENIEAVEVSVTRIPSKAEAKTIEDIA